MVCRFSPFARLFITYLYTNNPIILRAQEKFKDSDLQSSELLTDCESCKSLKSISWQLTIYDWKIPLP